MTYKQARRLALRAYKKAKKVAEDGGWREARGLTKPGACAFCVVQRANPPGSDPMATRASCPTCPALAICRRRPYANASKVLSADRTSAVGLRHFALTIKQLEALEV